MTQLDVDLVHDLKESVSDGTRPAAPAGDRPGERRRGGMEALLRWRHPERGVLLPGEFLPVAAAAGLMPLIGWWVHRGVRASRWRPGRELPPSAVQRQLWVNVAGLQLAEPGFTERIGGSRPAA